MEDTAIVALYWDRDKGAIPATAEYGYAFHFPAHMDGTPLTKAELDTAEPIQ